MDEVSTAGTTGQNTMGIGRRTKSRDLEPIPGLMDGSTRVSGWTTTWTELGFILGKTADLTEVSTKTTKSMAMEFILGLMAGSTQVIGVEASSMG